MSPGPYTYEGAAVTGDVFVARLSTDGERLEWVWIFEAQRGPPEQLWTDKRGNLYFGPQPPARPRLVERRVPQGRRGAAGRLVSQLAAPDG